MRLKALPVIFSIILSPLSMANLDAFQIPDSKFLPVFVGGWGSCDSSRSIQEKKQFGMETPHNMFLFSQATNYVKNINKYAEIGIEKFVMVCATKGSQNGFFAQGGIRMLTYTVQGQEITKGNYKGKLVNLDSHQDNTYRTLIRPLGFLDHRTHLPTEILKEAAGKPIVIIGHSYGGWISKRIIEIIAAPEVYQTSSLKRDQKLYHDTVKQLENYNTFPIHTFFSLEGISAVRCRITESIRAGIQDTMGNKTPEGCKDEFLSFHQELNLKNEDTPRSLSLNHTAEKLFNWYNILLLDSKLPTRAGLSTVPSIKNIQLDIQPYGKPSEYEKSQGHPFKNAHHMLGFETETWRTICKLSLGDESRCHPLENINNKGRVSH